MHVIIAALSFHVQENALNVPTAEKSQFDVPLMTKKVNLNIESVILRKVIMKSIHIILGSVQNDKDGGKTT